MRYDWKQSAVAEKPTDKVFLACGAYIQHILFGNKHKLQPQNKHFDKSVTLLSSSDKIICLHRTKRRYKSLIGLTKWKLEGRKGSWKTKERLWLAKENKIKLPYTTCMYIHRY